MSERNFLKETNQSKSFVGSFESKSSKNDISPSSFSIKVTHPAIIAVSNVLMNDFDEDSCGLKNWHIPVEHKQTREMMIQCINHLILQRRPSATQEWISKLPFISTRIEKKLYYSANSIDEYSDPYTLVIRIQLLVKSLITTAIINPIQAQPPWNSEILTQLEEKSTSLYDQVNHHRHIYSNTKASDQLPNNPVPVLHASEHITVKEAVTVLKELSDPLVTASTTTTTAVDKTAPPQNKNSPTTTAAISTTSSLSTRQVSSQGCSRVFIIKVLISLSDFVKGKCLPSIFTFKKELVHKWLVTAKQACCNPTYMAEEAYYGGPPFDNSDPSTHWSEPHQLYTWWKNNVERKSKFLILQEDAMYAGLDPRRHQRARWCEAVVALSEVIRASSGSSNTSRIIATNGTSTSKYHMSTIEKESMNGENEDNSIDNRGEVESKSHTSKIDDTSNTNVKEENYSDNHFKTISNDNTTAATITDKPGNDYQGAWSLDRSFGIDMGHGRKLSLWGAIDNKHSGSGLHGGSSSHLNAYLPKEHTNSQTFCEHTADFSDKLKKHSADKIITDSSSSRSNQMTLLNQSAYRNYANTFPLKLFDLMCCEDESIVGWQEHGTAFQVRNINKFVNIVLPKHFKHNNFTSFQRQLNLYGFRRFASYEKGSYYHPQFQQGERALAESIRRVLNPISMLNGSYIDSTAVEAANSLMMLDPILNNSANNDNKVSMLLSTKRNLEVDKSKVPYSNNLIHENLDNNFGHGSSDYMSYRGNSGNAKKDILPARGYNRNTNIYSQNLQPESQNAETIAKVHKVINKKNLSKIYRPNQKLRVYKGLGKRAMAYTSDEFRSFHDNDNEIVNMDYMDVSKSYLGVNMKKYDYTKVADQSLITLQQQHDDNNNELLVEHEIAARRGRGRPKGSLGGGGNSTKTTVTTLPHNHYRKLNENISVADNNHVLLSNSIYENYLMTEDPIIYEKANKKKKTAKTSSGINTVRFTDTDFGTDFELLRKAAVFTDTYGVDSVIGELEGVENDLLDLRNPISRRVYLDFVTTTLQEQPIVEPKKCESDDSNSDYLYGFYHGILHIGSKDQQFHEKLHSSKLLVESLLKLNQSVDTQTTSGGGQLYDQSSPLDIRHTNEMYAKSVRIGNDYQANIPSILSSEQVISNTNIANNTPKNNKRTSRRSSVALENIISWSPDDFDESKVEEFLALLQSRKLLTPISIGMVLVVNLPVEKSRNTYRLCCITDILPDTDIPKSIGRNQSSSVGFDLANTSSSTMKVFDGFKEWIVPISACMRHMEGEMEQALLLFKRHNGIISPHLIKELDALVQTEANNCYKQLIWTSEEVKQFFTTIKKVGDDVQKVWEIHFSDIKSLEEVQEFFLRIYPHTQFGGIKRVVKVYYRAEMASAGYPDGIDTTALVVDDDISNNDINESSDDYDEDHEEVEDFGVNSEKDNVDDVNNEMVELDDQEIIIDDQEDKIIESEEGCPSIEISPLDDNIPKPSKSKTKTLDTNTAIIVTSNNTKPDENSIPDNIIKSIRIKRHQKASTLLATAAEIILSYPTINNNDNRVKDTTLPAEPEEGRSSKRFRK